MMIKEAMKLALEALEWINRVNAMEYEYQQKARESLNAIYEALAEQPAQQEPVAWMTEEHYAEMHTSKWTPKIQQVFSKDGILESQTIQYAPQSKTVPYPPAQRTWVGLSDLNIDELENNYMKSAQTAHEFLRAIEAKLKERNQ